jgi:hypothetical protein|tara:strand:- start:35 stop:187 length:153 start_codon:yes stop_codon:yes gene_type:complete
MPYISHKNTPTQNISHIGKDISFTLFDLYILTACGIKAIVVKIAARNPIF